MHAQSIQTIKVPRPEVEKAKSALGAVLQGKRLWEARQMACPGLDPGAIYAMLSDSPTAPDDALPDSGVGLEWERVLSRAMIVGEHYGTRCSTEVCVPSGGDVAFVERTRNTSGEVAYVATHSFALAGVPPAYAN